MFRGGRSSIAPAEYLELFQVNVNRVLPFTAIILQNPSFHAVSLHGEADLIAAHEAVIHYPAAVGLIKGERPRDARSDCCISKTGARQVIEVRGRCRIYAAISSLGADPELKAICAPPCRENVVGWRASIILL